MVLSFHVDDLLTAGSSMSSVDKLKHDWTFQFDIEACGEVEICLRLEISRNRNIHVLAIAQEKYTFKFLNCVGAAGCTSASTQIVSQIEEEMLLSDLNDSTLYRQAIKTLMFL